MQGGVVVHSVPKVDLDPNNRSRAKETIKENNEGIKATRIVPLMRKQRNPSALTQSVVIFLKSTREADQLICIGVSVSAREDLEQLDAKRYIPQGQLKQCFNCQGYGHKAAICTRKPKCGSCSEEHQTNKCKNPTVLKCVLCDDGHHSWSNECKKGKKEIMRLKELWVGGRPGAKYRGCTNAAHREHP